MQVVLFYIWYNHGADQCRGQRNQALLGCVVYGVWSSFLCAPGMGVNSWVKVPCRCSSVRFFKSSMNYWSKARALPRGSVLYGNMQGVWQSAEAILGEGNQPKGAWGQGTSQMKRKTWKTHPAEGPNSQRKVGPHMLYHAFNPTGQAYEAQCEIIQLSVLLAVVAFLLSKSCGYTSSCYGPMFYGNRQVRTRLLGGVGVGGEKPPATRLENYSYFRYVACLFVNSVIYLRQPFFKIYFIIFIC